MEATKHFIKKLSRLLDNEQYRTALDLYEQSARSHIQASKSHDDRSTLLMLGTKLYYRNQMYEASNACLNQLCTQEEDSSSNIDFIIYRFQILSITGKNTEALEFILKAIASNWNQDEHQKLNFYLGKAYFWNGDYIEANHCFQQCYRYYLPTTDRYMLGSVLYMLGYTAFQRSFFDIAGSFYEKALEHFRGIEKSSQISRTHQMLGILTYRTGRYTEAIEHLQQARSHFEKCESKVGIIESDIAKARVSIFLEDYKDAEQLLLECCKNSKEIEYKRGVALSLEFLGEIYFHQAQYSKSLSYLEIAAERARELAPTGDIAVEVYRRLGDLFIDMDELDRADEYISKAHDIAKHLNDRYELGAIYRAYGMLLARKHNIDRARSFFMESIVTLQVIKERYELARTYVTAAKTYRQWCDENNLSDEYKNDLLRDVDTYEIEAIHLYQSLDLGRKVKEIEARRRLSETQLPRHRRSEARYPRLKIDESWVYRDGIVFRSSQMGEVIDKVENLAPSDIPIFITGETGTGKEIIAKLFHQLSNRASGPFVPVNCASISDTVFESELFGHKKGAFTGAISDKIGLIEQASGGTLFLDEISELTDRQQAKLLRALEESSIRRVGETKERHVDVRVLTASNEDIGNLLNSGKLRTDFFFRISVERIELPPLRERREDIMALFGYYVERWCGERKIERDIPRLLEQYHWPGNVRELVNVTKALAQISKDNNVIRTNDLPLRIRDSSASELKSHRARFMDRIETRRLLSAESCKEYPDQIRELIISCLERCSGNRSAAARELGICRTTLYHRMKELDLL